MDIKQEALKEKPVIPQEELQLKSPLKKKMRTEENIECIIDGVKDCGDTGCSELRSKELKELEALEAASLMDVTFDFCSEDEVETSFREIKLESQEFDLSIIQRCKVKSLEMQANGSKIVELQSFGNKDLVANCTMSGSWSWESNIKEGCTINVRAIKSLAGEWMVYDDPDDICLLVEEPDVLLSCTTVMSALRCRRAAVLSELFKGLGKEDRGGYLALGKLMHEVTQQCLEEKLLTQYSVEKVFESLLKNPRIIFDMYTMENDLAKLKEAAQPYFSSIAKFLEQHASPGDYLSDDLLTEASKRGSDVWPGKIDEVVDIEDTLWMPQFGLKGKLDVTGRVKHYSNMKEINEIPLELKTGRMDTDQVSHRGQLMLYSAMMAEAEQKPVQYGLLIYLKNCAVKEVRANKGEMRDAIILRNELAKAINGRPEIIIEDENNPKKKTMKPPMLPAPIKRPRECIRCPYLDVCTAYSSKEEYDNPVQKDRLKEREGNLTENHINYFIHWACLTQLEEQGCNVNLEILWTKAPHEREADKRGCLSSLKIESCVKNGLQFTTILSRAEDSKCSDRLDAAGINVSDFVVFGNQKRIVLSLATVKSISADKVEISVDKDFSKKYGNKYYTLDIYKSNRMLTTKLVALASLLANTDEAFNLRRRIIDRIDPKFVKSDSWNYVHKIMPEVLESLNMDQKMCVQRVLEAQDYVLVQGLPGSGKTSTIVTLVRILAALGFSILVTSHTNSAVDNVLCRLLPFNLNILRLGASSKFANSLKDYTEAALSEKASSIVEFDQLVQEKNVIGVTCTSANNPLLRRKHFDYCIVDEATQVPQPSAISALLCAKRFVLVGDPDQLQPVVTNKDAKELGMEETLFERLQRPQSTAVLGLQYRMNASICDLANKITYKGALKCGNDQVAQSKFLLPKETVLSTCPSWLRNILTHENGAVFVDTGKTKAANDDEPKTEDVFNEKEAALIAVLVETLIKGGVICQDIGVMTPFRRQVALISASLRHEGLDISTIDQFQGKDKLVCLVSFTKSFIEENESNKQRGGILTDFKRLTVAITRARVKLILVGDLESLQGFEPLRQLKEALQGNIIGLSDPESGFTWESI
ncbi:DNA replication ATP-dependent helicase/nuclease DNA2 isoform X2 [Neocloeon triangulifer]|nr:DNA replication ATP-dependent helicase/nuclease DNA2 isoform X2 [Neocloeon triangulifer]XP_059490435.1 DNA replication ATP-dependent helicase/nuclease DNA2 isoform X2 [Neocloeon triangulifer]